MRRKHPQLAITSPDGGVLWCEDAGLTRTGKQRFYVINGAWEGTIDDDGNVYVKETRETYPGGLVFWRGFAEGRGDEDYNEVCEWLKKKLPRQPTRPTQPT
jgi:hypothetical protein